MKLRSLLAVPLVATIGAMAQDPVADQFNTWVMYFGNHRMSDRWGLHTEYQWRRHDGFEHWQQSLLRLGVDHYTKAGP